MEVQYLRSIKFFNHNREGSGMGRRRSYRPLRTLFDESLAARADGVVPLGAFNTDAFGDDGNVTTGCDPVPPYWIDSSTVSSRGLFGDLHTVDPLLILVAREEAGTFRFSQRS